MAPKLFTVQFDKPDATYQPGETITGCVIIDLEENKNCRDFRIAVKGFAYVHWTESHSDGNNQSKTEHYSAKEKYFDFQQPLIYRPAEDEGLVLPAGRSEFRFTYQLPTNIPCSFEHDNGYIRYTIKAVVDIPWRLDWWTKAAFTVVAPVDLNAIAHQCGPIEDDTVKNYFCCCFNRGSISAQVKIPSTGYVPGQTIDTDVSFNVKSSKIRVPKVSAILEEEITFYAESKTKTVTITLQKARYDGPFEKNQHILLRLYVPPVPPSNLLPCDIIKLDYRVVVNVHVNGLHRKLQRTYPILIGTIPLHSSIWPQGLNTEESPRPSAPIDPSRNKVTPYPNNFPETICSEESSIYPIGWTMPLPSYEECMQQANNMKDVDDSHDGFGTNKYFAPRYPVFNFGALSKLT